MKKGMAAKQKELFIATYDRCVINFCNDVCDWGRIQIQVMEETQLKAFETEQDFIDFARESFLHSVKRYYDEHYSLEAAVQATRSLINHGQ